MTNRFKKHAPSGVMSAEDWINLQQSVSGKRAADGEEQEIPPFQRTEEKVGRSDPCPCDSGKKY